MLDPIISLILKPILITSEKIKLHTISSFIMLQFIVASVLFAATCATPAGPPSYHAPVPSYKPIQSYHEPKYEPSPYHYAYGVSDEYAGTNFEAAEDSDGNLVTGHYTVLLPDGRRQNVKYTSDHYTGYIADVSYEGYAAPAPVHKAAPYHPAPVHKPAPVYHPAPVHKPVYHAAPLYKPAPYHG
jgi:hypothetical protein